MYSIIYEESCSFYAIHCSYRHPSVFRAKQHDPAEGLSHLTHGFPIHFGSVRRYNEKHYKNDTGEGLFFHDYCVGQLLAPITGKKMSVCALTANPKT